MAHGSGTQLVSLAVLFLLHISTIIASWFPITWQLPTAIISSIYKKKSLSTLAILWDFYGEHNVWQRLQYCVKYCSPIFVNPSTLHSLYAHFHIHLITTQFLTEVDFVFLRICSLIMEQKFGWFIVAKTVRKWPQSWGMWWHMFRYIGTSISEPSSPAIIYVPLPLTFPSSYAKMKPQYKVTPCNFAYLHACLCFYL